MATLTAYDLTPTPARPPCVPPTWRPGTVALLQVLDRRHPAGASWGIFNCRAVRGGTAWSKHANSEAVDWHPGVGLIGSPAFVAEGDRIAAALVDAAPWLGVQRLIWNGRTWTAARGWRAYHGTAGPHRDHLHIELTRDAAQQLTMAAVMAAYGLRGAPRKDPDMANPTDIVATCVVASKTFAQVAVLKLERQGGILSEGDPAHFHGSMLSVGMREHLPGSSRVFASIATLDFNRCEYAVTDSAGHVYRFTTELGRRLEALEA